MFGFDIWFFVVGDEVGIGNNERRRRRENGVIQVQDEVDWLTWPCSLCFLSLHPLSSCSLH